MSISGEAVSKEVAAIELFIEEYLDDVDCCVSEKRHSDGEAISLSSDMKLGPRSTAPRKLFVPFDGEAGLAMKNDEEYGS